MEMMRSNLVLSQIYRPEATLAKAESQDKEKLKEVCQQFESIFINYMLKSMRATVPDGGLFDKGVTYDIVLSMHDQALAEEISLNGGIGLAKQLYEELSKYV
ncbi:MAG TPA: flagellar biosynthesis protein FlgJ [Thermoanaerobacterales bacterium]|uniref:rod-binding protein n=1 Tax=Tepidanaerobacter sp. GT38 TaxID=2722793 RepID=UPI00184E2985|nr:rod-binding protein [Tepidanaerobacter sp. GT38]MCG1012294.1 rod-binding protein [Tepidanaerobacter sp. GT38]HHY41461.1 flagellar biosynthesis protein FlgJ [Thermoanaerobacterales bacterium]